MLDTDTRAPAPHRLLAVLAVCLAWLPMALADEAGPRLPPGAPDLVVDPTAIKVSADGAEVRVEIGNRGSRPSGATSVRLLDAPPLQRDDAGAPAFPRHRILPGERALVIWPENSAEGFRLRLRWQGNDATDTFSGRLRLLDATGAPISGVGSEPAAAAGSVKFRSLDEGWITWQAATGSDPGGFDLRPPPGSVPAAFTLAEPRLAGVANVRQIFIGNWWLTRYFRTDGDDEAATEGEAGEVTVALDDPRLAHVSLIETAPALVLEQPLPSLDPGARSEVVFRPGRPAAEWFVEVDPGQQVVEMREGNNVAAARSAARGVMVALHTHASLSEGTASVDAQMDALGRSGYDAVFWTEHDWRVSNHGKPPYFGFEDDAGGSSWLAVPKRLDAGLEAGAAADNGEASEGERSLALRASHGGEVGRPLRAEWAFRAYRGRQIRALAQDLSLSFDLRPGSPNPFASEFRIELELSDQPRAARRMRYRIEAVPHSGAARQVVLPAPADGLEPSLATVEPGRWTRVVIPVSRHAAALFPEGLDNALTGILLGVAAYEGDSEWRVDRLELEGATAGDPLLAMQEAWTRFYPGLASHVSPEISYYLPHFNVYADGRFLLDYDSVGHERYVEAAVDAARSRSGALALAHPLGFGMPYPPRHVEEQFRHRLFGADMLEAGYRFRAGVDLAGHLAFWDRALAEGIPASGIGVTDAHGAGRGNGFERDENNFATWLGAFGGLDDAPPVSASDRGSLVEALLGGNLLFGDPLLFRGRLRLDVDQVYGPGAVVISGPRAHSASVAGEGLPPGGRVELIVDGRIHVSAAIAADGGARLQAELPAAARSARAQVWDARGEPVVFSNAVLLLRDLPPEGLPAARLRAETARGALSGVGRYRVEEFRSGPEGLLLRGRGGPGALRLEGAGGEPGVVTAVDSGEPVRWSYNAEADVLTLPLSGSGLQLRWSRPALDMAGSRWWLLLLAAAGLGLLLWWLSRARAAQA